MCEGAARGTWCSGCLQACLGWATWSGAVGAGGAARRGRAVRSQGLGRELSQCGRERPAPQT